MKTVKLSLGRAALVAAGFAWATSIGLGADASENWNKHCASCHAKDGSGNTKMGKKLKVKDYRDAKVQAEFSDDVAMKAIKEGAKDSSGKETMKPFAEKLSDDEAKALVGFLRSLKGN